MVVTKYRFSEAQIRYAVPYPHTPLRSVRG